MDKAYRDYLASDEWKKKAQEIRAYYHYKCAVCDLDYKEKSLPIHVHHLYYRRFRKSVIGREHPYFHVRLLCKRHHPKGRLSKESIQLWRKAYRFQKRWSFFFDALAALAPKKH